VQLGATAREQTANPERALSRFPVFRFFEVAFSNMWICCVPVWHDYERGSSRRGGTAFQIIHMNEEQKMANYHSADAGRGIRNVAQALAR
jgi:hypothetical protein